jgi:hypothetical protein
MKKATSILLAGMLIATIAGVGIVSAAAEDTGNTAFFSPMYRWAGTQMRNVGDNIPAYCQGLGYYGTAGNTASTTIELKVETAEEAIAAVEDATGQDITESNVYQMGRWWVFTYTNDDGEETQGRIDAFTGKVIENFYQNTYQGQQYRQTGRSMRGSGYGGGCAGAGYRY